MAALLLLARLSPVAQSPSGPVVGVDLGTTYSCVAIFQNGRVEIIANDQGNRVTPSYVAFAGDERLVGDAAKTQAALNPENTVYDAKRLIGRRFKDEHVQSDMQLWPFKVVEDSDGKPAIRVTVKGKQKLLLPQEISAMVLSKMRDTAELLEQREGAACDAPYLPDAIAQAYLRQEVRNMVARSSFSAARGCNHWKQPPAFHLTRRRAPAGTIAGLNVLRILNEPTAAAIAYGAPRVELPSPLIACAPHRQPPTITLLHSGLDRGGDTQTILVFDLGGGTFDVSLLIIDSGVRVEIDSLLPGFDFSETLTQAKFEELCTDLFRQTLLPVEKVLEDAGINKGEVDQIVLVGGSTRIPKVQQLLTRFFDGKAPNLSINPDEAVAYGAAAGVLSGERDKKITDLLLLDVTPLTLGIEIVGGMMASIIPRNTVIPTQKTQEYTTSHDNQVAVMNKVFEGERKMASDNRLLGMFELTGFPAMARGAAKVRLRILMRFFLTMRYIEVTFDLDANGILSVSAIEKTSGKKAEIRIENKDKLSSSQAVRRAEAQAELEGYVYQVKNTLKDKELRGRMDEDEVAAIQ
ncbi:MAG: hypothetical protein SGPRY_000764, partial [Prymnesium sp.]